MELSLDQVKAGMSREEALLKQLDVARNPFSAKAEQELQGACAPRREGHLKARPQLKAKLRLSCRPMPPKERLGEHAVGEDVLGLALRKLQEENENLVQENKRLRAMVDPAPEQPEVPRGDLAMHC